MPEKEEQKSHQECQKSYLWSARSSRTWLCYGASMPLCTQPVRSAQIHAVICFHCVRSDVKSDMSPEGRTCNFSFVGEIISLRQRKQTISGTGSALSLFVFFSINRLGKLRQFWRHRHAGGHIRICWWKSRLSGLKSRLSSEEDLLLLTGVRRDF